MNLTLASTNHSEATPFDMPAFASLGTAIADRLRRVNWIAAAITLALEGILLLAFISLGVVPFMGRDEEKPMLAVLPTRQATAPMPPAPTEESTKPVVAPQPKTDLVAPQPKIELKPAEQPVAAAAAPPAPAAPAAAPKAVPAPAPAPAGPAGPVSVANINTNLLSGAPPSYPVVSRRKREQGTVVLRVVVSDEGRVSSVSVSRSSGFKELDDAALAAVRKWRWSPTIREGKPVAITGLVQIPFVLKNS